MKKRLVTVSVLLTVLTGICSAGNLTSEAAPAQPGQSGSVPAPTLALRPAVRVFTPAETKFVSPEVRHERRINRIWVSSLLAVAASTSMDAATSWGKREGNGFLASSDGTFGVRGVGIKAGMLAGVVIPQLIFRNHKELKTKFAIGNLIEAGIFTGVSIHNLGVTTPR